MNNPKTNNNLFDLVLKNGTAVLPDIDGKLISTSVDIGIYQGKIAAIDNCLANYSSPITVDCKHLHILPGVIDSQVHFREPGLTHKEDLASGTKAALLGGVTSIFEMPNTNPSTTTKELLADKFNRAQNRSFVNYAFYAGGTAENIHQLIDLEKIPGCPGIKVFMGSSTGSLLVEDDATLEQILRNTHRRVVVHSEDEFRLRERRHIAVEGKSAHFHPQWRDELSALHSTQRLIYLAEKTQRKVHVLHISSAEEIDFLKDHKQIASIEVLPQHLTLFAPDCYDRLGNYAQQNPPIRSKRHYDRLWQAVNEGLVDVLGSDHAPHTREEKNRPYPDSPSGVPGVQTLVPIMLNHVYNERLSLLKFVELVSEGPKRIFGIQEKGRIAVGFDADLTIVDLKKAKKIENSWIASKCGWTPFDGMNVTGWVNKTIVGGSICMEDDQIIGDPRGKALRFV